MSEETDREWRRTCRQIIGNLIQVMGDRDVSPADIAAILGRRVKTVERWIDRLIDGREDDLRPAHDIARALGCRLRPVITEE